MSNGVLVLSTGRPGLFLWFSTDVRGRDWQAFDLQQHHNSVLEKKYHNEPAGSTVTDQTTAYTAILEVAPNRLMVAYDRTPFGWKPVPVGANESSQIFVMEMDVQRT
jgi:hypothetical protein